jgi:hypothetical protein
VADFVYSTQNEVSEERYLTRMPIGGHGSAASISVRLNEFRSLIAPGICLASLSTKVTSVTVSGIAATKE